MLRQIKDRFNFFCLKIVCLPLFDEFFFASPRCMHHLIEDFDRSSSLVLQTLRALVVAAAHKSLERVCSALSAASSQIEIGV